MHTIIRSVVVSCGAAQDVQHQHCGSDGDYREGPCAWGRTASLQSPHGGVLNHIGDVKSGCVVPLPKAWLEAGLPSGGAGSACMK